MSSPDPATTRAHPPTATGESLTAISSAWQDLAREWEVYHQGLRDLDLTGWSGRSRAAFDRYLALARQRIITASDTTARLAAALLRLDSDLTAITSQIRDTQDALDTAEPDTQPALYAQQQLSALVKERDQIVATALAELNTAAERAPRTPLLSDSTPRSHGDLAPHQAPATLPTLAHHDHTTTHPGQTSQAHHDGDDHDRDGHDGESRGGGGTRWVSVRPPTPNGGHDSLSGVAGRALGDPTRWPEIYRVNHGHPQPFGHRLTDPNRVYPGERLELPIHHSDPPPPVGPHAPEPLHLPLHPGPPLPRIGPHPLPPHPAHTSHATSGSDTSGSDTSSTSQRLIVGGGVTAAVVAGAGLFYRLRHHHPDMPASRGGGNSPAPPTIGRLADALDPSVSARPQTPWPGGGATGGPPTPAHVTPGIDGFAPGWPPPPARACRPDPHHDDPSASPAPPLTTHHCPPATGTVLPPLVLAPPASRADPHPTNPTPPHRPDPDPDPPGTDADVDAGRRAHPDSGVIRDIGIRSHPDPTRETPLRVDLAELNGLGLTGPGAPDTLRALLIALLHPATAHPAPPAHILIPATYAHTLLALPEHPTDPTPERGVPASLQLVPTLTHALDHLDSEVTTRRLRQVLNPPEPTNPPPPALVLITTTDPDLGAHETARLQRVLHTGGPLGIAAVLAGTWTSGTTCHLDDTGTTTHVQGSATLRDTQLYALDPHDTRAALHQLANPDQPPTTHPDTTTTTDTDDTDDTGDFGDLGDCEGSGDFGDISGGQPSRPPKATGEKDIPEETSLHRDHAEDARGAHSGEPTTDALPTQPLPSAPPHPCPTPPTTPTDPTTHPGRDEYGRALLVLRAFGGPPRLYGRRHPAAELTEITSRLTRGDLQLLQCLAAMPRPVSVSTLHQTCWPNLTPTAAANALHSAISRLRSHLRIALELPQDAPTLVVFDGDHYQLNPAHTWIDHHAFHNALKTARTAPTPQATITALSQALALYHGPLLEGIDTIDWLGQLRDDVTHHVLTAALTLAEHLRTSDPDLARHILTQALTIDPTHQPLTHALTALHPPHTPSPATTPAKTTPRTSTPPHTTPNRATNRTRPRT